MGICSGLALADSILRVGLTGGIGSGKTTASDYFESLGVPVIDTDIIAREIVEPGQPALEEISRAFDNILNRDGYLDRKKLRNIIFSDDENRLRLEDILHPRIRDRVEELITSLNYPYCIIVVPLLLETRYPIKTDRILVIDTDPSLQYKRVRQRDQLDDQQIDAIMSAQTERKKRLAVADDVIVNDGDLFSLQTKLDQLHADYLRIST